MNVSWGNMKIVLGITGGIAAYKAAEIASRLTKAGAEVHVVMTDAAQRFITPLTLREITGRRVYTSMWDTPAEFRVEHIALANLADLVLVAPATADFIAKTACGLADDLLTTVVLATKAPLIVVPAMNTNMYLNTVTQENMARLKARGVYIIPPATGHLACGTDGIGRLPEPAEIVERAAAIMFAPQSLRGKKIIVTAGGTRAPIDPVRFIGNRSSGKMGYAVAAAAAKRGGEVVLISAPTNLAPPPGVKFILTETAAEMRKAVLGEFADAAAVIMAAAVSDYRVKEVAPQKIKKHADAWSLELVKETDILYELGQKKQSGQILVGFAAETENLSAYAAKKLREKNLDFIVANNVSEPGAGFGTDTNIAFVMRPNGEVQNYPLLDKTELADIIVDGVCDMLIRTA